eukprot:TRINITY_DN12814_c0_g1_i3.p1 TRINITY_DN12814_c0_g1~~TRINITY_DN12814_c0_g1_i3.p1  ORF type:complete len:350 (+),score=61.70 TRINITY_DN12814_c0_g1_i3:575-1624(+)
MVWHSGQLLCLEEASKPWQLSVPSLRTVGRATYQGKLTHNFTAHPKVCPVTCEMMLFGYDLADKAVQYSVVSPQGELISTLPVLFREPVMTHDMAITRHYSILMDFPLWDMAGSTRDEDLSRIGVLPRHCSSADQIKWFELAGQFGYHTANAFEGPESTITIVICSARPFAFQRSNVDTMRLRKWTLHLKTGKASEELLGDVSCDFPVIHPELTGLKNRYVWASRLSKTVRSVLAIDALVRYDLQTDQTTTVTLPEGKLGGECRMIPSASAGVDEAAGVCVMFAYSSESFASELMIFDASLSSGALAVLELPWRVPCGFHALWVPADEYHLQSIEQAAADPKALPASKL